MSNNKELLKVLKQKEKDLIDEFETTELGKQLKGIRSTISLFENGYSNSDVLSHSNGIEIPATISEAQTWDSKILFALNNIKSGFVDEIVDELVKHGVDKDDNLKRRVSVGASSLKRKGKLGGKSVGIKTKYFIK